MGTAVSRTWRYGLLGRCALAAGLTAGPALAGPPFRTDDPETVDYQHFEVIPSLQGTKAFGGWAAALPAVEANYGALPNLQLHVAISQGFVAPAGGRTGAALGNLELAVKYRFVAPGENDWFPQVAFYPAVEVPTGNQKFGLGTGHTQVFLPLWLQKDFEPWTVYGGGGYWINPGFGNKNFGFVGIALWRKMTEALNLGVEVFHQTAAVEGEPGMTGFDVGATYDLSEHWHLLASAGTGLQNRPATNQFSYYLGLQWTF